MTCQTYRVIKEKTCKSCQTAFSSDDKRQYYCSSECKKQFGLKKEVRQLTCENCNATFTTKSKVAKTCSVSCRIELRTKKGQKTITCDHCCKEFTGYKTAKYCGQKCWADSVLAKKNVGIENIDYIICPVCNAHLKQISNKHAKLHGYDSSANMKIALNLAEITCQSKKEKSKGDKNAAFNHGGKYSKFSKNFIHGYNKEWHQTSKDNFKLDKKNNVDKYPNRIEYWIKKANGDIELGKQLYKEHQTRDLKYFVKKYGEVEGTARHAAKTEKWVKTMSGKPIDELRRINESKVRKSSCFYSKAEKEIFNSIKSQIPGLTEQVGIERPATAKRFYIYDMCYKNKIIEYNGDFWHANPDIYTESFVNPYSKLTFNEIRKRDEDKLWVANNAGYDLMVVWESDYNKNKEELINKCLTYLTA